MTPEEQRAGDMAWLKRKAREAERDAAGFRRDGFFADAAGYDRESARYRRILAALTDRAREPAAWLCTNCGNAMQWSFALCDGCDFVPREKGTPLFIAPRGPHPSIDATPPGDQATSS